jgi:sulfatase maturation enzyme AslB (radical SAM superfamily)
VTANGDAFPCVFSRTFLIGNVLENSLTEMLNSRTLRKFRDTQRGRNTPVGECSPQCDPGALCTPSTGSCNPTCDPGRTPCNPQVCNPSQSCGPMQ